MKDKTTAALLAFFLGGLGAHKFYLNRPVLGIVYFFFCWTFIPLIVAFIEAIMFFCMSKESFDQKYNQTATSSQTIIHQSSSADEILKLKDLFDKGIITQEEFDNKKSQLIK